MREQAFTRGGVRVARAAVSAVTLKPAEPWNAAAVRVLLAFRDSLAKPDRPRIVVFLAFYHTIRDDGPVR